MHIPPRRSRGCAQAVVYGHTRRDPVGFCEARLRPVPVLPRGKLLRNARSPAMRCQGAGTLRCPKAKQQTKRPGIHCGSPGLCERWQEVRLRVSWSRTVVPTLISAITRLQAVRQMRGGGGKLESAGAQHRGRARKADLTRGAGQMLGSCVGGYHDGVLWNGGSRCASGGTVNSLYGPVKRDR